MNALAFMGGMLASLAVVQDGLAQQAASPRPQIISITGGTYVLPRQAGSKDAPDVALATSSPAEKNSPKTQMNDESGFSRPDSDSRQSTDRPRRQR